MSNEIKSEINWKEQFEKIASYTKEKFDYEVCFKHRKLKNSFVDAVYHDKKRVIIDQSYPFETATYYLLHEVGHVIQAQDEITYNQQFGSIFNGLFSKSSMTHKVAVLNEEFDAWNKGLELSEILMIPIDRKKFETLKTKCLMTYVQWVGKKKNEK